MRFKKFKKESKMDKKNQTPKPYQSNGYWYFYAYDRDGKRKKFSTGAKNEQEAKAFIRQWMKCPIVPTKKCNLRDTISPYLHLETNPKMNQSAITGGLYGKTHANMMRLKAKRLLEDIPSIYLNMQLSKLSRTDCIHIREIIWKKHGSTSVAHNEWKAFKTMISYAAKCGEIQLSPAAGLEDIAYKKKERLAIPYEDVKAIMDSDLFLSKEQKAHNYWVIWDKSLGASWKEACKSLDLTKRLSGELPFHTWAYDKNTISRLVRFLWLESDTSLLLKSRGFYYTSQFVPTRYSLEDFFKKQVATQFNQIVTLLDSSVNNRNVNIELHEYKRLVELLEQKYNDMGDET